ncbi:MAG: M1 family metallopeptidase [Nitrospirae bacterium]|nr:MAG: M1 family metallopeptidase [Nitrospirota bacterium]
MELNRATKDGEKIVLDFDYAGELNDPPKEPRHLRFVTPSETSGHIGPEGVYIGPETAWYPDLTDSFAIYRAMVTTPPKWETIGQGTMAGREVTPAGTVTTWDTRTPAEGLTLTAGQYLITTRNCDGIETAAYLYPEEHSLAELYLGSACSYLRAYIALLGPYPFPRFSVVENFFASGLGLPSYTLLGTGSIRRRYIQPYALGHEIVHSWIGNYVYNDHGGNWVEGLTTYLANYYWYELQGDREKARDERRLMLFTYAVYVSPQRDYPIAQFKQKVDAPSAIARRPWFFICCVARSVTRRSLEPSSSWSPDTADDIRAGAISKRCSARPRLGIFIRSSPIGLNRAAP